MLSHNNSHIFMSKFESERVGYLFLFVLLHIQ